MNDADAKMLVAQQLCVRSHHALLTLLSSSFIQFFFTLWWCRAFVCDVESQTEAPVLCLTFIWCDGERTGATCLFTSWFKPLWNVSAADDGSFTSRRSVWKTLYRRCRLLVETHGSALSCNLLLRSHTRVKEIKLGLKKERSSEYVFTSGRWKSSQSIEHSRSLNSLVWGKHHFLDKAGGRLRAEVLVVQLCDSSLIVRSDVTVRCVVFEWLCQCQVPLCIMVLILYALPWTFIYSFIIFVAFITPDVSSQILCILCKKKNFIYL